MKRQTVHRPDEPRSGCPIAAALDLVGDRWTLLVLRDVLIAHKSRYAELAGSAEGIPTNILADRLKKLEAAGLVSRVPYQDRPPRHEYVPTEAAKELMPVLWDLFEWAVTHVKGVPRPPTSFVEKLRVLREASRPASAK